MTTTSIDSPFAAPAQQHILRVAGLALLFIFALSGLWLHDFYAGYVGDSGLHRMRVWEILWAVGFIGYVAVLWTYRRHAPSVASIVVLAVLLRLLLLFTVPNTDVYRYMWEGRMQRLGFNPYLYAPDAPELEPLRDEMYAAINHKAYAAVYPPLTMLECRLLATVYYHPKTPQVFHTLLDMLVVLALVAMLRSAGAPLWYSAIYALNPLTLAAVAQGGHNDPLMLLPLLGFIAAGRAKRWHWAGAALGLAVLAKTTPVILLAVLARRSWKGAVVALLVIAGGYAFFADAGLETIKTLVGFPLKLSINSPVDALRLAIREWGGPTILLSHRNRATIIILAIVAGYHFLRPRDFLADARRLLCIMLLFSPIIQFWYITWPLALLTLVPRRWLSWILLSGTMLFWWEADHAGLIGEAWELPPWAAGAVWLPFFAAWGVESIMNRRPMGRCAGVVGGTDTP